MPGDRVRFVADMDDKVSRKLTGIRGEFSKLADNKGAQAILQGVGLGAGLSAVNALSSGVGFLADTAFNAIADASDLNETISKGEQIFGKNAEAVERWADGAAEGFGASKKAAIDAASGFAGLFQTVGIELDQSTDMSQKLTELGSDLASFYNTDVSDALGALKSGLNGEAEPLRRFNVFLSDNAVQAKAAEMGMRKVGGQLTEQQKQLARYSIIMDQTSKAQGDFDRTSDGLANTQRSLAAEMENLSAEIGQELLPVALEVSHWAKDEGVPALRGLIDVIKDAGPAVDVLTHLMNPLGSAMQDVKKSAEDQLHAQEEATAAMWAGERGASALAGTLPGLETSTSKAGDAASTTGGQVSTMASAFHRAAGKAQDMTDALDDFLDEALRAQYGPDQLRGTLAELEGQLHDDVTALHKLEAIKNPTAEQRRDIAQTKGRIAQTREEIFKTRVEMAKLNGQGLEGTIRDAAKLARAGGRAAAEWWGVVRALNAIKLEKLQDAGVLVYVGRGSSGRASGGAVEAGRTYKVGEMGEEYFVPSTNGRIVSHDDALETLGDTQGGGRGWGGLTVNFNSTWPPTPSQARDIAALIDRELYYMAQRAPRNPTAT